MSQDPKTQDPNDASSDDQDAVLEEEIEQLLEDINGPKKLPEKIGDSLTKQIENIKKIDLEDINNPEFWDQLKQFGVAGLSAATGDPEAMKTIVEVIANATHLGLEKIELKNESHEEVKKKIEDAVDSGADGLINTLTWFQKQAGSSNQVLREKYGRKYKNKDKDKDEDFADGVEH